MSSTSSRRGSGAAELPHAPIIANAKPSQPFDPRMSTSDPVQRAGTAGQPQATNSTFHPRT
jgi:hypothetical protein